MTETYFRWKRTAFKRNMKNLNDAMIKGQREVMQEMGHIIENGFNEIVRRWSDESRPTFKAQVVYRSDTRRFFVYCRATGTALQLGRFKNVDEGLVRHKKLKMDGVEATVPNKVRIKGIQYPYKSRTVVPAGALDRPQGQQMSDQEYAAHVKKVKAQYTTYVGPRGQAIGKFGKDRRMPVGRRYYPFTGKGGLVSGPGKYFPEKKQPGGLAWKSIEYAYEVQLADIEPRFFTAGLSVMLDTGQDRIGVRKLWPRLKSYEYWVARGYSRGSRYAANT